MKSILKNNTLVLLLLVLISFSCSKDDDPIVQPVPEPTAAEMIANKWYLVKQTDNSTTPPTEMIANDCQKNTYYNFLSDGNIIAEGFSIDSSSNCVSSGTETGTYSLTPNGESIIIETQTYNIDVISTMEFVFSFDDFSITFTK